MPQTPSDLRRVLVTGGTGLLGRAVVRRLIAIGSEVCVLSRLSTGLEGSDVQTYCGDVTSYADVGAAVRGCDAVIHCAGEKRDASRMQAVNVDGTRNVVDAVDRAQVAFFCHVSSVGVIGRTRRRIVTETTPCRPMNHYERTKLAAERIALELDDLRRVVLRPTNVFSQESMRPWVAAGRRFRLKTWLKSAEHAHFVYVEDAAAAALHFLRADAAVDHPDASNGSEDGDRGVYIVSSDFDPGNTYGEIEADVDALCGRPARRVRFQPPLLAPWLCRLPRHGVTNSGGLRYSSRKLEAAGFRFPFGLRKGVERGVLGIRESDPMMRVVGDSTSSIRKSA